MPSSAPMNPAGIRSGRLRDLARSAQEQGFRLELAGNGHPALISPEGDRVSFSASKRDSFHAVANVKAALRRIGYQDPTRHPRKAARIAVPVPPSASPQPAAASAQTGGSPMTTTPELDLSMHIDKKGPPFTARRGKAVSAEDVSIGGQPFRVRHNADGGIAVTTLRRKKQRSWERKNAAGAQTTRDAIAAWVRTVPAWEEPTFVNEWHPELAAAAPDPEAVKESLLGTYPEPVVTNVGPDQQDQAHELAREHAAKVAGVEPSQHREGHALARHVMDVHVKPVTNGAMTTWSAVRVDDAEYPIARALDELETAIMPALAALEAAGKPDAAALVRAEIARTPAEDELVRLWQEVHNRPRLEHS